MTVRGFLSRERLGERRWKGGTVGSDSVGELREDASGIE